MNKQQSISVDLKLWAARKFSANREKILNKNIEIIKKSKMILIINWNKREKYFNTLGVRKFEKFDNFLTPNDLSQKYET